MANKLEAYSYLNVKCATTVAADQFAQLVNHS